MFCTKNEMINITFLQTSGITSSHLRTKSTAGVCVDMAGVHTRGRVRAPFVLTIDFLWPFSGWNSTLNCNFYSRTLEDNYPTMTSISERNGKHEKERLQKGNFNEKQRNKGKETESSGGETATVECTDTVDSRVHINNDALCLYLRCEFKCARLGL